MNSQAYTNEQFQKLLERLEHLKAKGQVDLSMDEDLSVAIMNLVSLEEHFFFTATKVKNDEYFDFMQQVREIRGSLMKKLIDHYEGETWCITKHLHAATMRLIEVGTKLYAKGKKKEAKEVFAQAKQVYSLFWGMKLKLVSTSAVKKIPDTKLNKHDINESKGPWTLDDIVNKLVDCCKE